MRAETVQLPTQMMSRRLRRKMRRFIQAELQRRYRADGTIGHGQRVVLSVVFDSFEANLLIEGVPE